MPNATSAPLHKSAAQVRRAVVRLARRLRALRPPQGLSAGKLAVLGHLYHHGPASPGEIAAAEQQQPQTLTRVFAELHQAGLVSRTQSRTDRRQSVLELTPEGREVLLRDVSGRDAWLAEGLGTLSPAERHLMVLAAELMERLTERT